MIRNYRKKPNQKVYCSNHTIIHYALEFAETGEQKLKLSLEDRFACSIRPFWNFFPINKSQKIGTYAV